MQINKKITKEIAAIEKLEIKMAAHTNKLKTLISRGQDSEHMAKAVGQLNKSTDSENTSWGPGRKVPSTIREEIEQMLESGATGAEIRKRFNVSLPTIYKIKSSIGLVKHRPYAHA